MGATKLRHEIRDLVLLRYVLIIAVSYLVISQRGTGAMVSPAAAILVASALMSNVALGWTDWRRVRFVHLAAGVVVIDTIWLSVSLSLLGHLTTEFFFLYFFVLFFAALAENLLLMLAGVVAASGAYLWVLTRLYPGDVWTEDHLLQLTFLFSAAVFYGVLVSRARQSRRAAEVLEAMDRERTELLATLAHDIGGPAHIIGFAAETLARETAASDATMRPLLDAIVRNSRVLKELTERFLEYSRIRTRRFDLDLTPVVVAAVAERAAAQYELDARTRGVTLAVTSEPIPTALLDELALTRVLGNVVGNAIRYCEDGATVEISVALEADVIAIVVRDTGRGMTAEQRATIGRPFVAPTDATSGSGLGLFIVRSLVEAHGGSMTTASERGRGTEITLRLPFVPAPSAAATATPETR
ncbi:MAG: HAMP domain-containing histidine kinase [Deltaproteobacteria bacterium]|nr:MAG: HAMP domain-containing histidine kinase [Deltaproteobacteria bacterium]